MWAESETVENHATIRFDPPLANNEYIRDMIVKRKTNGQVKINSEICKFTTQITSCERSVSFTKILKFISPN